MRVRRVAHGVALGCLVACCALAADDARADKAPGGGGAREEKAARKRGRGRVSAAGAKLLQRGIDALASGDLAGAARALGESFRESPGPEPLYHLGVLALREGRAVDARDLMRRYLADPDLDAPPEAQLKEAERVLQLPAPPSGALTILGERGLFVTVDDRLVGRLPLARPLLLTPAEHRIQLHGKSHQSDEQVTVRSGRLSELRSNAATGATLQNELPAVIVLEELGGVPADAVRALRQAAELALQAEHLSPLPTELALEHAAEPELSRCLDMRACQARLGVRSEADAVLVLHVDAEPRRPSEPWSVRLTVVDPVVGDAAAAIERSCAGCSAERVAALLGEAFATVWPTASARPRGRLSVKTEPPGADLYLDGHKIGAAPLVRTVWAGPHELRAQKPPYTAATETVTVPESQTHEVALTLPAPPPPAPAPPRFELRRQQRPLWRVLTGAAALGGGALMLGIGGRALVVNDGCALDVAPCTRFYDTRPLGIGLLVGGAVLAVGGAVLVALPGPQVPVPVPQRAPVEVSDPARPQDPSGDGPARGSSLVPVPAPPAADR